MFGTRQVFTKHVHEKRLVVIKHFLGHFHEKHLATTK